MCAHLRAGVMNLGFVTVVHRKQKGFLSNPVIPSLFSLYICRPVVLKEGATSF